MSTVVAKEQKSEKKGLRITTKELVLIAMFGAVSTVLMMLDFPMPFMPPFIKMDFSELPVIIGGLLLGPLAGTLIVVVKIALNLLLDGSTSIGVGEFINMVGSLCYMLPAVLIYKKIHTRKGAALALLTGTVVTTIAIVAADWLVVFPAYAKIFGMKISQLVEMSAEFNPLVKSYPQLMLLALAPFNILKYSVVSLISYLVYKKISVFAHNFINK